MWTYGLYLSAITNPTLTRIPEAGRNGSRSRDMAIPTVILSLRERESDLHMLRSCNYTHLLEQRA